MQLDLNLLTVLDALLEEGSVLGAANRLRLTSPAVSRSLGRIRRLTGDDILVRTGRTMTPTPYAVSVRDQVGDLVRQAQSVLAPTRELDLAQVDRVFTVRCHDALSTALAPRLLDLVAGQAPRVRLRLMAEASGDTDDLRHGRVDLDITAAAPAQPEFRSETIGHDRLVVALRRGHPDAGRLDLDAYAARPHVLISRRGRLSDPIDDVLRDHGVRRRILATVATSATALRIVTTSDAVVTVPERVYAPLIDAFDLVTAPVPVELGSPPIVASWHQRYDSDPAHAWLRAQVKRALAIGVG